MIGIRLGQDKQRVKSEALGRVNAIEFLIPLTYIQRWSDRSVEVLAPTALPRPQGPSRDAEIGLTAKVVIE